MPIIRARYPDNWESLALQIKHQAQWCCEQCQRPCRQPSEPLADFLQRVKRWRQLQMPLPAKFEAAPRRYLLTVAHLDQQPSNQDPSNLKALCTVCHLRFDSRFRAKQRRLKAEFLGQLSIDDAWPEGLQLSLLPQAVAPFSIPRQGAASKEGRFISRKYLGQPQ
ncbi:MAG: hypothetical protein AAF609_21690 [Cyanobacteria bacterium P01_C01_bin.120]